MKKLEDIEQSLTVSAMSGEEIVFDECELLDDYEDRLSISSGGVYGVQKNKKSSHELVEMARDGKTPKRIRDGEFGECLHHSHKCYESLLVSNSTVSFYR